MKAHLKKLLGYKERLRHFILNKRGWTSKKCELKWKKITSTSGSLDHLKVSNCKRTLLPTPTTGSNRNSRNAILRLGEVHRKHGTALGLAQVLEVSVGILPKEFDSWKQVPAFYKRTEICPPERVVFTDKDCHFVNPLFVQQMMGFPNNWIISPFL